MSVISHIFSDPNVRIGRFSWLVFAAIMVETMIEIKFGWEILTIVPPRICIIGWTVFFVAVVLWTAWRFTYPLKEFPVIGKFFRERKKMD